MKSLFKALFATYLLVLLWLVLFKTSIDIPTVLAHQERSLNLLPFAQGSLREMISNFVVFVPFGLLLGVAFKQIAMQRQLIYILAFSVAVEIIQYVLAIGVTDITDVIMNTLGGLAGVLLYDVSKKHSNNTALDRCIAISFMLLLAVLLWLRFFVFRVRY